MNSEYKTKVINNNYRYIDWSEKKANLKALNGSDFKKLKLTIMFFGRKFDGSKDSRIMDLLDTFFKV